MSDSPDDRLTWKEVQAIHGSRRGIRITADWASLLLDFGLSRYANRRDGSKIYYEGEGKHGDQTPTAGNAGLLACLETRRNLIVFERVKPGIWYDRGDHLVTGSTYQFLEVEGRMVYEFVLEPVTKPVFEPVTKPVLEPVTKPVFEPVS
jgi:hypothetical protein